MHDDAEAAEWAQVEHVDAAAAATAAEAATAQRKEKAKKWTCADCGRANKERSAVRGKGGGYVCLEGCGLMEGRRERKGKGSARWRPARERLSNRFVQRLRHSYACARQGVSK